MPNLPRVNKIVLGYNFTPILHQQKKCISPLKIVICIQHKSQKLSKYSLKHHKIFFSTVTIRYTISDSNDASKMFIRLTGGDG